MVGTAPIDESADHGRNDRETLIKWAAGFVDGEGCIQIVRASGTRGLAEGTPIKRWYRLNIEVAQIVEKPLLILRDLFGGSVIYWGYKNLSTRPAYRWDINATKAKEALKELLPYLIVKEEEARLAIEFREYQEINMAGKGKPRSLPDGVLARYEQYCMQMRKLHHRGSRD